MTDEQGLGPQLRTLSLAFLAGLSEQWGRVEAAWARVNFEKGEPAALEKMEQQVHSLAGAAGSLGFQQIAQTASDLQNTLRGIQATQESERWTLLDRVEAPLQAARRAIYAREQIDLAELAERLGSARENSASLQEERADRLIYMIEDDPMQATELAVQIGYFGYSVQTYHQLVDLETALAEMLPTAILMDISFPEGKMAGLERVAALQATFPGLPPVIFISINADTRYRLEAVRVGGEAYFTKPVDVDALVEVLDRLVFHEVVSPYRILIVDDSHIEATFNAIQLKKAGMEAEIVLDPYLVIDRLISFNPDLVLLDMYLPDCTGIELARIIRQMEQFLSIPIVFLSAETDKDKQITALGFGGDDFLTKPMDPQYLVAAVNTRVERYRKLRSLMIQDGLTGLLSHSTTKERLAQEVERARRQNSPLAFAMLDLDNFKAINDAYGHLTGDRVLKSLAQMLKKRLRKSDTIGRYGGEEFAIIFPNTAEAVAYQITGELCAGFAKILHHIGEHEFTVTFSAGVAAFPVCASADALISRADAALYAAKFAGRNQVISASRLEGKELTGDRGTPLAAFDPRALDQSALYPNLLRQAKSAILRLDGQGTITSVNEFSLDFFGFRERDLIGHQLVGKVIELTASNSADWDALAADIARHPDRYANCEYETTRPDGQKVWAAWSFTPLLDERGNLVQIVGIGNDITARKMAAEELRGTVARLSALNRILQVVMNQQDIAAIGAAVTREVIDLFAAFHVGIALLNEDRTRLIFFGNLLCEGNEDLDLGNQILLSQDRSSREALETGRAVCVANAMTSPLTVGSQNFLKSLQINSRVVVPLIHRGRPIGTMNIDFAAPDRVMTPPEIELAEVIGGAIAGALESSLLFNAEQRQRQYFEALVNHIPTAVVNVDLEARIRSWNPAAEMMFGFTAAEALGQNIDTLLTSAAYRQEAVGYTQNSMKTPDLVQSITRRQRKDGTQVDVELLAVPLLLNGNSGAIAIYHDISELQRARHEAETANKAKSAFLATMSHEIRTPLNAIIGMTTLLLDTALTSEQHNFSETIRASGEALLTIINDVLDFSKIEAGRLELEEQPFDLRECLESALDLFGARVAEKGIDVAYLLDPDVPQVIVSDAARLRQILLNLLSNALKFTETGEVVLAVSAEKLPPHENSPYLLHFSVRDTGIGIPSDRMDRLFQSFSQVDASTTRKYGGTGLGLAISKRLAELMGGSMRVESAGIPGQGATFHFTICARSSSRSIPVFLHRKQPELTGKRVLIVDDNATNRYILVRQVQSWGMIPHETADPHQALAWIGAGREFDVILLDMQMPAMDGVHLAAEIQRAEGAAAALPIVMLTSLGLREMDAEIARFAAYLTKPIKPAVLYSTLLDIFGSHPGVPKTVKWQKPSEPERGQGARAPLTILLAEDHVVNQQVALHLLNRLGYRADVAANGQEVLAALQRQFYDVILMDVQMPEMDGLETTRRVRASRRTGTETAGAFQNQPYIIAMTANAMQGDREICLEAGMDAYLSKPIRLEDLSSTLANVQRIGQTALPAGEEAGEDAAIDAVVFRKFCQLMGENEVICSLIQEYLRETPKLLSGLQQAVEDGQVEQVRRFAHSLKSSSMLFGAMRLAEMCQALEAAAREGHLPMSSDPLGLVHAAYAAVDEDLTKKCASRCGDQTA